MLRPPASWLCVGISSRAVTLVRAGRFGSPAVLATAPLADGNVDTLGLALAGLLDDAAWRRWPVSFVLDDELVRMWTVVPPPHAARMADLHAAAGLRFEHLYGDRATLWHIAAHWDASRPFMAAAIARPLHAAIVRAAGLQRLAVTAIEPHFVAAWNAWRGRVPRGAWFMLLHGRALALGITHGARLVAMRAAPVPAAADESWLEAHVAREALLLGVPAPAALFLCGQVPTGWKTRTGWVIAAPQSRTNMADVRLALAGVYA